MEKNFIRQTMRPAWVEIDLAAIDNNIKIVLAHMAEGAKLCGVVKANAYGHGLEEVTKLMLENGVDCFAVASIKEAMEVRTLAPDARIIMLGMIDDENMDLVLEEDITMGVCEMDFARRLSEYAVDWGKKAEVIAFVDTGMGRIGFQWDDVNLLDDLKEMNTLPGLRFIGLQSHFSSVDSFGEDDLDYTKLQFDRFESVRQSALKEGIPLKICSLASSVPALTMPETHYQLIRPGVVIYGGFSDSVFKDIGILPTETVKAKVMFVKKVLANYYVGYGRAGKTERVSRIATLPIGYADGIPRSWGVGKGYVLFNGRKAPIIGKVCMDQLMVDITDLPDVDTGDVAVIIGKSGDQYLGPAEIAASGNDIINTVMCGLSLRLPYIYKR